ncbi:MAG: flavodoxin domain-containing protein [Azospirillaceae bacterium]
MALDITIYVGTMTGTAEMVAEEIQDWIESTGGSAEIVLMDDLDETAFDEDKLYFICTSTYGQGDVPDNAQAFYDKLKEARPDLSHVRYGLIGLGDSTYQQTFAFGGKQFDRLLGELGASRIGDAFYHDASGGDLPEEVGLDWFRTWAPDAEGTFRQAA